MALLFSAPLTSNPDLVTYRFRFQIDGTNDPDNVFPGNSGITDIVRDSAGVFTITFDTKHPAFVGGFGVVMPATPVNDQLVKIDVADYSASDGTLALTVVGALDTTAAAEDPADNDWVYLELTFCRKTYSAVTVAV